MPGHACVQCKKDKMTQYRLSKKEDLKNHRASFHAKKKALIIKEYGGKCDLCGEVDPDVLTVDHLWGKGSEHRKEVPASRLTQWLIDNKFPRGFRILCFNCNFKSHLHMKRTGGPLATLKTMQKEITRWADRLFPSRTVDEILRKLEEERDELMENGGTIDPGEYADVLILVLDLASQFDIDVEKAVLDKMAINESRTWKRDESTGTMRHV